MLQSLNMKKTKIVCTLGPTTTEVSVLKKMIHAGMNVARINMSHGDHIEHMERITNLRKASRELDIHCGILVDLSGPKIRTGDYTTPTVDLVPGKKIILTTETIIGDEKRISVSYAKLPQEVHKGSVIMLDDGRRKLVVNKVEGNEIHCTIEIGGIIKPRRGVNIPNGNLSIASLTAKDKKDLDWALEQPIDIDFVALSFVRTPSDVEDLQKILKKKNKFPEIIAKIETAEAIEHFDKILETVHGVMIARGDLSVETPREKTPIYQKELIRKSIAKGKYTIVATQMMESMINAPQPTRAEVSDVANAIFDGTDAIMTSEETSLGEYPVETVTVMASIARNVEDTERKIINVTYDIQFPISHSVAHSVQETSERIGAKLIVALTESGRTAQEVAHFRGTKSILALTPKRTTAQKLSIVRGVTAQVYEPKDITDSRPEITALAKKQFNLKKNDIIIIASGGNMRQTGATNMMMVEKI